jgi:hypothetical protein
MAGYSSTPLPKKLGIEPGMAVALVNAPNAFERTLGPLPDGVFIKEDLRGKTDLVVLFASRMADIYEQFPRADRSLNDGGRLWMAWPKQASGVKTDVTQPAVREFGLAAGWVDSKSARSTKPGQDSPSPAVTKKPSAPRVSVAGPLVWYTFYVNGGLRPGMNHRAAAICPAICRSGVIASIRPASSVRPSSGLA